VKKSTVSTKQRPASAPMSVTRPGSAPQRRIQTPKGICVPPSTAKLYGAPTPAVLGCSRSTNTTGHSLAGPTDTRQRAPYLTVERELSRFLRAPGARQRGESA
jgi:hypothetical protein